MKQQITYWHKDECRREACRCGKSSIQLLLDWLAVHDGRGYVNFTRWKGGTRTKDGMNKATIAAELSQLLERDHNLVRNVDSIKAKLQELIDSYTKAKDFMTHTGEGIINAASERIGDTNDPEYQSCVRTIHEKCHKICKHWDVLDEVMGDRASTVPVALATNEDERVVDLDSLLAQRDYVRDDDDVVETAHEYTPGSPPSSTLMAKRPNQSGSQEKLKKKLKIEPPKKGLNLAESVFKGMKIRVDAQAEMSRALVDSKAKEFEYKVEQDARQLAIKQKEGV
ncbi:Aste57867_16174 [Aphanomyces stellatus]|uniref:Aste57867_16174 protein n=1 Tax=Aphanomyces stellatus TaxID=120398 RepID=A0A485L5U8_9STRA|nr:hypothetical protein As57867_016118 [Aphanomyces stellatus]VFT92952.1 Aste57867_16174 [Aphanomyces stellatus]